MTAELSPVRVARRETCLGNLKMDDNFFSQCRRSYGERSRVRHQAYNREALTFAAGLGEISNALHQKTLPTVKNRSRCHAKRPRFAMCRSAGKSRSFWVLPESKEVLTTALEGNLTNFMFTRSSDMDQWSSIGCFNAMHIDGSGKFEGGFIAKTRCAEDVEALMSSAGSAEIAVMDAIDWKVIPAENLIASFQNTPTKLFAMVHTAEEAKAMFGMLQVGVDGCVLRSDDVMQVAAFAALKREMVDMVGQPIAGIAYATITAIRPVGVGERVCVDMCSLLREDEGLMVGSSSQALFLVLSEAAKVAYVPSRPFRVNSGPVHSYCLVPGGKTKYLAELRAGDEVLVVGEGGQTSRSAVVGRAKVETRPLLLIEAETGDRKRQCTVFVQNAETVRLAALESSGASGMKSVTNLRVGDRLVLKTDRKARHIGIAIDEDLVEK